MNTRPSFLATVCLALLPFHHGQTTVLIHDDFTGATGNPDDSGYFMAAVFEGSPASTLTFQDNEMRFVVPIGTEDDNQGIFIHFPQTTLEDGEFLRFTLDIGSAALGGTTNQLQLTLANATALFSENVETNSWTNVTNYSVWIGAGGTNSSRIRTGTIGGTPTYLASSSFFGGASSTAVAGSNRTIVFEVHRVSETDHRLTVAINDTLLFNNVQAPDDFSTFNTLGIAIRSAGGTVERNIGISAIGLEVIPEPTGATLLLIGLGFLTFQFTSRRHRRQPFPTRHV